MERNGYGFFLLSILLAGVVGCQAPSPPESGPAGGDTTATTGPAAPEKVKRGGILRGTWSGTLAHLDMHQVGVLGTWNAGTQMHNGLIEWDAFDRSQQKSSRPWPSPGRRARTAPASPSNCKRA